MSDLIKAQVIGAFDEAFVLTLILCSIIMAFWAGVRPDLVRDSEGRRLPPSLTARITFIILFVTAYLALTMAFHFGTGLLVTRVSDVFGGFTRNFFRRFDGQAPLLALIATWGLYSLAPFREMEQLFLSWLHNTRHLRNDMRVLSRHLVDCPFFSEKERRLNIESLQEFDFYITNVSAEPISLASVTTWHKTASLLRMLHEWNASKPRLLSERELSSLAELQESYTRKTRLATDIIRMLKHMREDGDNHKTLSGVTKMLADAPHGNRSKVSDLEEQVQANLQESRLPSSTQTVRLSSDELREYLKKIESYFLVEYKLMLEQAANLAAKTVLRAGDEAPQRLDELKAAGFEGLGSIHPLSAHRIIWFLLSVAVGGFLIYYVSWIDEAMTRAEAALKRPLNPVEHAAVLRTFVIGIAVFVSSIALASLVGALFASGNAHVRARETPWGTYVLAGMVAALAFFGMQLMRETVTLSLDATIAAGLKMPSDTATRLKNFAPWTLLPFLTAMGICWLARQNPWQTRLSGKVGMNGIAAIERGVDGLVMGTLMVLGMVLSLGVMALFGIERSGILKPGFDPQVARNLFVFGFFVGALVTRDVRSAAHAQVVAPMAVKAPDSATVVPFAKAA